MDMRSNLSPEEIATRKAHRDQTKQVRAYMEWFREHGGRRMGTPKSAQEDLDDIRAKLEIETDILEVVVLEQKRLDAEADVMVESKVDPQALEEAFVGVLKAYSLRKGLTYRAWRAVNVPAKVLVRGGLRRPRR